jgi:ketosteroid isomerase-like protein
MRILAVASLLALAAATVPAAENEAEAQATFKDLEMKVMAAARASDVEALGALVSPDFAWAIAFEGRPPQVMNRSEWIQSGKYIHLKSFDISGLVAETLDQLALVTLRLSASGTLGPSADVGGPYVVTDLWKKKGKTWTLLRRFLSAPAPVPTRR